jgi:hypothetical protein
VSVQLHAFAALPSEERTHVTHRIGDWVGLWACLDDMEKRKFLTLPGLELDLSVVRPVACVDTGFAIPAPKLVIE